MGTVSEDIKQVTSGIKSAFAWFFGKLLFWRKTAQQLEQSAASKLQLVEGKLQLVETQAEDQVVAVKQNFFNRVFGFFGTVFGKTWSGIKWFLGKLKFWGKKSEQLEEMIEGVLPDVVVKSSIFQTLKAWYHEVIDYIPTFEEEEQMQTQGVTDPRLIRHQNKKYKTLTKIHYKIFPRARLTYWLGDEEVVAYVNKFHHHHKFKISYCELKSRRNVVVVSAVPLNFRLEQLRPGDVLLDTDIQQNQIYSGMNNNQTNQK